MRRRDLEHVLRAACQIAKTEEALVIGSQAILGAYSEDALPPEAFSSIEVDLAFLDDARDELADRVDGAMGELSSFHETFGYYAQGVSVSTAILPPGWRDRLIVLDTPGTAPGRGLCLEPHDLVVSKLVAFRDRIGSSLPRYSGPDSLSRTSFRPGSQFSTFTLRSRSACETG